MWAEPNKKTDSHSFFFRFSLRSVYFFASTLNIQALGPSEKLSERQLHTALQLRMFYLGEKYLLFFKLFY